MGDTENEETPEPLPPDLLPSAESTREYYAYLVKLYDDEGNLTFLLWAFDKEVRRNYELIKREYASEQAILGQHKDIGIRLDAIEKAVESLEDEGAALFGLPGVIYNMMHIRKNLDDDEMMRSLICGEKAEENQRNYYRKLMSIKKLVEETIYDIWDYLEGATILDLYEDSQEIDLYSCLHRVMGPTRSGLMRTGWRGRSSEGGKERYDVFISHAGEDKRTMAIPLSEGLSRYGVNCFLDIEELRPGDLGWESMMHAMKTAPIGVIILSPEFAAKRWPMIELNCFLKRQQGEGVDGVVVPVFYRLEREDCGARLLSEEVEMFERLGFFERVRRKETSEKFVVERLQEVAMVNGIENEEGAGNWNSEEMRGRRERLIEKIVDSVRSELESYPQNCKPRVGADAGADAGADENGSGGVVDARQYY